MRDARRNQSELWLRPKPIPLPPPPKKIKKTAENSIKSHEKDPAFQLMNLAYFLPRPVHRCKQKLHRRPYSVHTHWTKDWKRMTLRSYRSLCTQMFRLFRAIAVQLMPAAHTANCQELANTYLPRREHWSPRHDKPTYEDRTKPFSDVLIVDRQHPCWYACTPSCNASVMHDSSAGVFCGSGRSIYCGW